MSIYRVTTTVRVEADDEDEAREREALGRIIELEDWSAELVDDEDTPELITFRWSRNHGDCVDCGRPAAFKSSRYLKADQPQVPEDRARLCALCAANDAADGEVVRRIEEHDEA